MTTAYEPRRPATQRRITRRGIAHHLTVWGDIDSRDAPLLWMMHGFMDVGASFQFVVDAMDDGRCVIAPDWRGFGQSVSPLHTDCYWFPDYVADLDSLLDAVSPDRPVDLLGHSMGGNVVMSYAGVRPGRIRKLINLEGFGLPDAKPADAPGRLAKWLDEMRSPMALKPYANREAVAQRMMANNPRLAPDRALWLAGHWAAPAANGQWQLQADAAHRRINPVPYRANEVMATWARISAPLLWVQGDDTQVDRHWAGRYSQAEFDARLAVVPNVQRVKLANSGHMLHHDQPEALARHIDAFLSSC